jgi:D-alanyl-D-alanine carboxypeptidase
LITSLAIDIDINNSDEDPNAARVAVHSTTTGAAPDDDVMQLEDRMAQRLEHEMNQQEQQQLKQHYEQQQQQQQQQHDQQQQQDQPRPPEDEDEDQQQLVQELMESPLLQGNPIDDYFSRRHIQDTLVPLVVGGSDGSGTRARCN